MHRSPSASPDTRHSDVPAASTRSPLACAASPAPAECSVPSVVVGEVVGSRASRKAASGDRGCQGRMSLSSPAVYRMPSAPMTHAWIFSPPCAALTSAMGASVSAFHARTQPSTPTLYSEPPCSARPVTRESCAPLASASSLSLPLFLTANARSAPSALAVYTVLTPVAIARMSPLNSSTSATSLGRGKVVSWWRRWLQPHENR
mmetsp:Transcript_428/g.1129  ORF Transcript_428/g.1129 Transcript_428/m.1129 type:complete len:204 (+) Transcript_428:1184-1795(+)